jgi:pimeloyl-ACP methyl ester carboxylesterase
MFSETRYALNGGLHVAYRASREGERDIVLVPAWFSNCEDLPAQPPVRGWIEAMTSLGRLILFDQPGTGASDPVTPGALPTLELWADSITAVLDDLGSREAVLLAMNGALAAGALFAATHPSRTAALVVLEGYADPLAERTEGPTAEQVVAAAVAMWGTGEFQHAMNPDMPWNEEIRAATARWERGAASPGTVALMMPLLAEMDVRASLPTVRVPTLVLHHTDDPFIPAEWGKDVADRISGARYVELPGRNVIHFYEPDWRSSFQEIAQFLTGHQANVADDRVLATVLFTDIVNSTRRAAEMRPGLACLAGCTRRHCPIPACPVSRPRSEHLGRRLPRDVRRPPASDPLRDGDPRRGAVPRYPSACRVAHRRVRGPRR